MGEDSALTVRKAVAEDAAPWLNPRKRLWPKTSDEKHAKEISKYVTDQDKCSLLALLAGDLVERR